MKSIKKITESFNLFMQEHGIDPSVRIIAAYSGGPDSTALLALLTEYCNSDSVTAAWFNHRLRTDLEMNDEQRKVEETADRLGVRLLKGFAEHGEIEAEADRAGLSLEEAARQTRYRFLYESLNIAEADFIATGHNIDDNTETMMMRFFQNAGLFGLSGIPAVNDKIIRPLLTVRRGQIEEYLAEKQIGFCIDKTNLETDFLRNKIRHNLLSEARNIFPELDRNLYSLSGKIESGSGFIRREAEKRLKWQAAPGGYSISADVLYSEDSIIRISSVYAVLNRLRVGARIRYAGIEQAIEGAAPENGKILLRTSEYEIIAVNGHIFIQRLVNRLKKSYLLYLKPGDNVNVFGQKISVLSSGCETISAEFAGRETISVPAEGHIILRSYREGDAIETGHGKKSLKKIYNEWRVVPGDRNRIPVIEADCRIAAIAGKHLGYEDKIAADASSGEADKKILLILGSDTEIFGE